MQIMVIDAAGVQIEVNPIVLAMLRLLVKSQDRIAQAREATVELHYVSQTRKVDGKLKDHIGLERMGAP